MKKIILDTNVIISMFVISKSKSESTLLLSLIFDGKIELILSKELLQEIRSTAARPKFKRYFEENSKKETFEQLLEIFENYGTIITTISELDLCRDKKDNFLLNLCKDSDANFLITGDNDLLIIKNLDNTDIVSWSDFKNIISG